MGRPFLVVQLSDSHLGADWGDGDPVATLAATVDAVRAFRPDAVLISGDLADNGADAEYEQVRDLVARIEAPLHVLPGNHDDRAAVRRHFAAPGEGDGPVQYAADLGPVRLVVVDTIRVGADSGELDADRLAWLQTTLADAPDAPTIVALHHPPLLTGIAGVDDFALAPADQRALGDVVARHRQIRRIVAGHIHLAVAAELRGRSLLTAPSTYVQAELDFGVEEVIWSARPPGFVVHTFVDGELASHVQTVEA